MATTSKHPKVDATRAKLLAIRGHWPEVGKASGVSYSWLQKFAAGKITNPTVDTLQSVAHGCDAVRRIVSKLPSRKASQAA